MSPKRQLFSPDVEIYLAEAKLYFHFGKLYSLLCKELYLPRGVSFESVRKEGRDGSLFLYYA